MNGTAEINPVSTSQLRFGFAKQQPDGAVLRLGLMYFGEMADAGPEARELIPTAVSSSDAAAAAGASAPISAGISAQDQSFLLRVIQPGLAGLMDGSVSTLAPIFATAFATHISRTVFLLGAATAVGAGISMAFSEGLSDDGVLTGRGSPVARGLVEGLMTFIGGFLHTLPFLIPNVHRALDLAYFVVGVELIVIAFIRHKYFKTSFALSCLQVIVGGGLVFAAGVLIGSS